MPEVLAAQPVGPASPAGPPAAAQARQVGIALVQIQRSQWPLTVSHLFVAWVVWRGGMAIEAVAWMVLITGLNIGRTIDLRRRAAAGQSPETIGRVLLWWLVAIGLLRPVPVLLSSIAGDSDGRNLITMVMIGLTVGGASNLAGLLRLYLVWASPLFIVLSLVWAARMDVEGVGIAVLLVLMFVLLGTYVRDYGLVLAREMQLAESLRRERDRAESAIVAKNHFFASASHDLRQPLAALRWYGEAVSEHANALDNEALREIGVGIGRAVGRAEPLLSQYLEIARLEALDKPPLRQAVALEPLLQALHEAWSPEACRRELDLSIESSEPGLAVSADEASLRRILDNLIGNALKFTPTGRVSVAARLVGNGRIDIEVSDTGIGIDPMHHERVFDDFFQIGNPARSGERGVGLGLAIARRHAGWLGTRLLLASAPGRGTRITLELPAADATAPVRAPVHAHAGAVEGLPASLRLLLIDDDAEVRRSLQAMLESRGWTALAAAGADDAVAAIKSGPMPDVILVDHRLADGHTGTEAVARLRTLGCQAPAILVTGDTAPQQLRELQQLGLPVLHKPVADIDLLPALRHAITQRDDRSEGVA